MNPMTVEQAKGLLNCNQQGLADLLGVSKVAVLSGQKMEVFLWRVNTKFLILAAGKTPIQRNQQAA